jgi:hypothetical protein
MDHDRELDRLVALLEEHAITPEYDSKELDEEQPWGHPLIYERVRATPWFPLSADEVRALLEWRPQALRPGRGPASSSG